jgi:hypothetical protein
MLPPTLRLRRTGPPALKVMDRSAFGQGVGATNWKGVRRSYGRLVELAPPEVAGREFGLTYPNFIWDSGRWQSCSLKWEKWKGEKTMAFFGGPGVQDAAKRG